MAPESLKYWIALRAVEEVGCVGFRHLLQAFGSPEAVFREPAARLQVIPGIGPKTADHIRCFSDWEWAEREVARAEEMGIAIVTCDSPLYPARLLEIYDYPPFLYLKGTLLADEIGVAVVGSRLASTYGKYVTEKFSRELALQGITVVSGLARGIDAAAHRGALAGKGRTIAVLGCGLDLIYPPENESLATAIAATGAVVTEFPLGTPPNGPNFPARNRIISGLSLGVLVVEAGEKSGSLITARIAADQGRSVFAVPGAIESAGSRGTHQLIKQGAKLVENVADILDEVLPQAGLMRSQPGEAGHALSPPGVPAAVASPGLDGPGLTEEGGTALLSLIGTAPIAIEELLTASGLSPQAVLNGLLVLELQGLVRQLPGKMFCRKES